MEKQLTLDLQFEVSCPTKPVPQKKDVWADYAAKCREDKMSEGCRVDYLKEQIERMNK